MRSLKVGIVNRYVPLTYHFTEGDSTNVAEGVTEVTSQQDTKTNRQEEAETIIMNQTSTESKSPTETTSSEEAVASSEPVEASSPEKALFEETKNKELLQVELIAPNTDEITLETGKDNATENEAPRTETSATEEISNENPPKEAVNAENSRGEENSEVTMTDTTQNEEPVEATHQESIRTQGVEEVANQINEINAEATEAVSFPTMKCNPDQCNKMVNSELCKSCVQDKGANMIMSISTKDINDEKVKTADVEESITADEITAIECDANQCNAMINSEPCDPCVKRKSASAMVPLLGGNEERGTEPKVTWEEEPVSADIVEMEAKPNLAEGEGGASETEAGGAEGSSENHLGVSDGGGEGASDEGTVEVVMEGEVSETAPEPPAEEVATTPAESEVEATNTTEEAEAAKATAEAEAAIAAAEAEAAKATAEAEAAKAAAAAKVTAEAEAAKAKAEAEVAKIAMEAAAVKVAAEVEAARLATEEAETWDPTDIIGDFVDAEIREIAKKKAELYKTSPIDSTTTTPVSKTPAELAQLGEDLWVACSQDRGGAAKMLLTSGADPNMKVLLNSVHFI